MRILKRKFLDPNNTVIIYTDGSCVDNTMLSPGGWGIIMLYPKREPIRKSGRLKESTSQRAELKALLEALLILRPGEPAVIKSDSKYCVDGCNKWLPGWKKKGWRRSTGEIKHLDLWKRIDRELQRIEPRPKITWVKAHAGNYWNEECDRLAKRASMG